MNQGSYHIATIADKISNKMRRHNNVNISSFDIDKLNGNAQIIVKKIPQKESECSKA